MVSPRPGDTRPGVIRAASMEPCLFRHGKSSGIQNVPIPIMVLQWSHVFSDMVRKLSGTLEPDLWIWLQWSHVFSDMVRERRARDMDRDAGIASMEPCLFRHGKGIRPTNSSLVSLRLQWSHVFSDMVRTTNRPRPLFRPCRASMEPCLFRHGKRKRCLRNMGAMMTGFNGAMSFQTW